MFRFPGRCPGLICGCPFGAEDEECNFKSRAPGPTAGRRPAPCRGRSPARPSPRLPLAWPRDSSRVARTACQMLIAVAATSTAAKAPAIARAARCLWANFRKSVDGRRRPGLDRLVGQVPLEVAGQVVGRRIPPVAVLLQRLHRDPVELSADQPRQLRRLHAASRRDRGELPRSSRAACSTLGGSSSRIRRTIS